MYANNDLDKSLEKYTQKCTLTIIHIDKRYHLCKGTYMLHSHNNKKLTNYIYTDTKTETVMKGFASTYDTQTEKMNTRDQVKTAESGPNLLVQKCFHQTGLRWEEEICYIQHYNTKEWIRT